MPARFIKGHPAKDAYVLVKQLLDKQIVALMSEMKAQSPTGATGFGQLAVEELKLLRSAAGRLDLGQSEAQFLGGLNEIKAKLQRVMLPEPWEIARNKAANGGAAETPDQRYKRLTGGQ